MSVTFSPLEALIWQLLGQYGLPALVGAFVAAAVFAAFGKRWLNAQFDKGLESFRSEKNKEIERLKGDISRMLDRATKYNAREYEVLPEAWGLLKKAEGAVAGFFGLNERPDLNRADQEQLEEFLKHCDLPDWQKNRVREASDKNRCYSEFKIFRDLSRADQMLVEYVNYILLNGVFIDDAIMSKMEAAAAEIRSALVNRELIAEQMAEGWRIARGHHRSAEKIIKEVKVDIRTKLSRANFFDTLAGPSLADEPSRGSD